MPIVLLPTWCCVALMLKNPIHNSSLRSPYHGYGLASSKSSLGPCRTPPAQPPTLFNTTTSITRSLKPIILRFGVHRNPNFLHHTQCSPLTLLGLSFSDHDPPTNPQTHHRTFKPLPPMPPAPTPPHPHPAHTSSYAFCPGPANLPHSNWARPRPTRRQDPLLGSALHAVLAAAARARRRARAQPPLPAAVAREVPQRRVRRRRRAAARRRRRGGDEIG